MKDKNVFDMLENAEDEPMDELIRKCPDINGEKFDRLLAKTEKIYAARKYNIDNGIDEPPKNTVSGVEWVKRSAWIMPFTIAASIVLVAGITVGSIAMLNINSKNTADGSEKRIEEDTTEEQENINEQTPDVAQDVFSDKDALIALCKDAKSHYDKVEVTYYEERSSKSTKGEEIHTTSRIDNYRAEFDKNEKSLLVYTKWDNMNGDGEYFNSSNIDFFYKDKRICVYPNVNKYEVETLREPLEKKIDHYIHFLDPQAKILPYYSLLEEKNNWYIVGKDTVGGRDCVAIKWQDAYYGYCIDEWLDAETGVILKYSHDRKSKYHDGSIYEEQMSFEVTDIKYDDDANVKTPPEFRQMVEESGYEINSAVICNLDFLGIPAEPFTKAHSETEAGNE